MTNPPRTVWAYSYRLSNPQEPSRLHRIKALIAKERTAAAKRNATWEGRLVVDERVAHILILSDSPDVDREVNRQIEAELRALDAGFAVTVPMVVTDDPSAPPEQA
jgi:hypothetical protein